MGNLSSKKPDDDGGLDFDDFHGVVEPQRRAQPPQARPGPTTSRSVEAKPRSVDALHFPTSLVAAPRSPARPDSPSSISVPRPTSAASAPTRSLTPTPTKAPPTTSMPTRSLTPTFTPGPSSSSNSQSSSSSSQSSSPSSSSSQSSSQTSSAAKPPAGDETTTTTTTTTMTPPPRSDSPVHMSWGGPRHDDGEEELLPTMFTWTWGGSTVYVTGTWDNWQARIPLRKSTHDFTAIANLPPGRHSYKFIVDGRWKHAPEQPVVTDSQGHVTNSLEIQVLDSGELQSGSAASPPGPYGQFLSSQDFAAAEQAVNPAAFFDYSKPPPALPPQLHRSVLNMPQLEDDSQMLPLPHHVMLNHLYLMRRETDQDMVILGTTTRYRSKFVTTVFYKAVA